MAEVALPMAQTNSGGEAKKTSLGAVGAAISSPRKPHLIFTPRSAAMRFLEEKTGLAPTACEYMQEAQYAKMNQNANHRPDTRELLYHGISAEGNGRLRYLSERKKYDVHERHGAPVTFMQGYGT